MKRRTSRRSSTREECRANLREFEKFFLFCCLMRLLIIHPSKHTYGYIYIYIYTHTHTRARAVRSFFSRRWVTRCVADHNAMRKKKGEYLSLHQSLINHQDEEAGRRREREREGERARAREREERQRKRKKKKKSILNFFLSCFVLS